MLKTGMEVSLKKHGDRMVKKTPGGWGHNRGFEGYGPIGERRDRDLGGRLVDKRATFPDGSERNGVEGLRRYLREEREADFGDNLRRKLLSYALSRTLLLSDESLLQKMREDSLADGHRFQKLVEAIVTSPQFLTKRGRDVMTAEDVNARDSDER